MVLGHPGRRRSCEQLTRLAVGCRERCRRRSYFRVFNPVTQGKRFDPNGDYVRRWIPELAAVDTEHIHAPWTGARPSAYPPPILDIATSRQAALAAYARMRSAVD